MTPRAPAGPDSAVLAGIHQLYHRQSHLIDGGRAADWAATFTADATFDSPSYPAAVTGTAALTAFAGEFAATAAAAGVVRRHIVTNLVVESAGADTLRVLAYLQIVATPRGGTPHLERLTTLTDRVVRDGDVWRVASRRVRRDDTPEPDADTPEPDAVAPASGNDR
ncbi:nuclear transport factor 2 family protein [Streptomyces sp. NPDC102462]|uniref:nuclear transport factor 2 family protein n=1 Tax=Streptomyces sp. NPDC102462 TaxID=3366178 RepID=UPI0037FE2FCA